MNFVSELGNVIGKAPVIPVFGDGLYRLQPIALDVLARSMVDSLTMPETFGQTYEVGGPEKLTYREILKTIARAQGMSKKPLVNIPFAPVRFVASLLDKYSFFPLTRDQLTMLEHENIVQKEEEQIKFERTFTPRRVRFENGVQSFFASKP
jgi:NADH dehydrogenase